VIFSLYAPAFHFSKDPVRLVNFSYEGEGEGESYRTRHPPTLDAFPAPFPNEQFAFSLFLGASDSVPTQHVNEVPIQYLRGRPLAKPHRAIFLYRFSTSFKNPFFPSVGVLFENSPSPPVQDPARDVFPCDPFSIHALQFRYLSIFCLAFILSLPLGQPEILTACWNSRYRPPRLIKFLILSLTPLSLLQLIGYCISPSTDFSRYLALLDMTSPLIFFRTPSFQKPPSFLR